MLEHLRTVSVLILPSGKHCRVQVETVSTELRKKLGRYYTNQPKPPHHSWTAAWAVNGHAPMSFCIGMHTATLQIFALQLLLLAPSQEVRRSWSYIHTPSADDSTPNTTFHMSWIMSKPLLSASFREWMQYISNCMFQLSWLQVPGLLKMGLLKRRNTWIRMSYGRDVMQCDRVKTCQYDWRCLCRHVSQRSSSCPNRCNCVAWLWCLHQSTELENFATFSMSNPTICW